MITSMPAVFLSLPPQQRKTAVKREKYFIKEGPRPDWQQYKQNFSGADAIGRLGIFQFDREGKVWLKGGQPTASKPHKETSLDRIFSFSLTSGRLGLAALTMVLGLEWQVPAKKGTQLADRPNIFTAWLKDLSAGERGEIAQEGFDLTPETVVALAAGRLVPSIAKHDRYGEMFQATCTIAAAGWNRQPEKSFGALDPFYVSELGAYHFADSGLVALEQGDNEKAREAFQLSTVIVPGHTVIDKLIAEAKTKI